MVDGAPLSYVRWLLLPCCRAAAMTTATGQVSKPGGAGHALLFRNHVLLKKDFKVGVDGIK